jgi:putative ABC transport system permease protein
MAVIALKMLFGDRAKYLGLIFGVAFATLLIAQQGGLFVGLMTRTANVIADAQEVDIWVMDPQARYLDTTRSLRPTRAPAGACRRRATRPTAARERRRGDTTT